MAVKDKYVGVCVLEFAAQTFCVIEYMGGGIVITKELFLFKKSSKKARCDYDCF